jgi:hypothetical protein
MSSENIDLVNRIYKAFENRDTPTFFSLLSHEIHVRQCSQVPWGGVSEGIDEAKVFFGKVNTYQSCGYGTHNQWRRSHSSHRSSSRHHKGHRSLRCPYYALWAFKDGLAGRLEIVPDVPGMQAALRR